MSFRVAALRVALGAYGCLVLCGCYESDAALVDPWRDEMPEQGGECGDGVCDPTLAESCSRCAADCGECPAGCSALVAADGVDYASEVQPILSSRCTGCHDAGGDAGLNLSSFAGVSTVVTPCDCQASLIYQKTGPTPPYGDRMPADGPPYLSDGERAILCQWINEGATQTYAPGTCGSDGGGGGGGGNTCAACGDGECTVEESCADCPDDCGACSTDTTPPTFEGVDYVSDGGSIEGCDVYWDPAEDDQTSSDQIRYLIYMTPEDGAFDFDNPLGEQIGGEHLVVAPPSGQRYDVVVRAMDQAGNVDLNESRLDCDLR